VSPYHRDAVPGHKVDRASPPPPSLPIPLRRRRLGAWEVACCSDPIYPVPARDGVEHVAKRIAVEDASLLRPDRRLVISTANSWTKSYRLPLRVRTVDRVCWFAVGNAETLKLLRGVSALGKKKSVGYGRVRGWTAEDAPGDYSWYAPSEHGPVLMATLPAGPWLPEGLLGARRSFGAVVPPYWHPSRYTEILIPC
jgi:hypothetical protein